MSEVNFTDTKFMTGKEKAMVLKQWRTFLKNGMASKSFSKRLYQHLILHCNFIAHYDRGGFYETYFGKYQEDMTLKFINQFDRANNPTLISTEYGRDYWATCKDYADINQAMADVMAEYRDHLIAKTQAFSMYAIQDRLDQLQAMKEALLATIEETGMA